MIHLALVVFSLATPGVYLNVLDCVGPAPSDNFCIQDLDTSDNPILPLAIMHPRGFTETTSGVLTIDVCVEIPDAVEAVERTLATWNALLATIGNCPGDCLGIGGGPGASTAFDGESIVLHELGHCAFGLDHPTLTYDALPDPPQLRILTEFSASYGGSSALVDAGMDGTPGSADDIQVNADDVSWYRRADNNPVIIDATVIDINTFSRSTFNLPAGSSYAANANKTVAAALGAPNTRAVMYPILKAGQKVHSLSADDVNMVKMANTGIDITTGTPGTAADDYTVMLVLQPNCTSLADIKIRSATIDDNLDPDTLAVCSGALATITQAMPPTFIQHYTLDPGDFPLAVLEIIINDTGSTFDWGQPEIFADGFESGDFSQWDSTTP